MRWRERARIERKEKKGSSTSSSSSSNSDRRNIIAVKSYGSNVCWVEGGDHYFN